MQENLIRFMCEVASKMECIKKEAEHPKPEIEEKDELKRAIKEMLIENTGCHILDSGGAYGRHWEENRHRDFDTEPAFKLEIWDKDHFSLNYNVYHYLVNFLQINDESKRLQNKLDEFVAREDSHYMQDMEDFIDYLKTSEGFETQYGGIVNTYNYENIISQVLQYAILENEEGDYFIVLEIHNGCDVRGGYTKPRVFLLGSEDNAGYFYSAQSDIYARCEKCGMNWWSDDAGYNFYSDGCSYRQSQLECDVEPNDKFDIVADKETKKVFHKNCGGEIAFSVIESW